LRVPDDEHLVHFRVLHNLVLDPRLVMHESHSRLHVHRFHHARAHRHSSRIDRSSATASAASSRFRRTFTPPALARITSASSLSATSNSDRCSIFFNLLITYLP